jgi:hypothetical protein
VTPDRHVGLEEVTARPREEKAVITSPVPFVLVPRVRVAVVPGCAARNASSASASGFSRCAVGSQWLSVIVCDSVAVAPPPVSVTVDWKVRRWVEAATVVTQGPLWLTVPAVGPSLLR